MKIRIPITHSKLITDNRIFVSDIFAKLAGEGWIKNKLSVDIT